MEAFEQEKAGGRERSDSAAQDGRKEVHERISDELREFAQQLSGDTVKPLSVKEKLAGDPALRSVLSVRDEWIDWKRVGLSIPSSPKSDDLDRIADIYNKQVQMRAMIARNLFFQGLEVTQETVQTEMERIMKAREKYRDVTLFQGRNVLVAAHRETLPKEKEQKSGDRYRFGKRAVIESIRKQGGLLPEQSFIRPEETDESGQDAKRRILERIRTLRPPATFVFDGHGSPKALYLSDGEPQDKGFHEKKHTSKITVAELADAFVERAKNFHTLETDDVKTKDILILGTCYNSNFIRSFYESLGNDPKPVALGMSEYGQEGYSELSSPFGSQFYSKVLDLGSGTKTTIGTVYENELKGDSNPSLYIPDELNRTMQISKEDRLRKTYHNAAA
ncbi:MAG: Uncharacterized protein Greene041619_571 [Candidatus Peregrinibacteria bacterium Greene0416_19]|nr:MAG: Uncharacterized protein Greene041619_571 [Candidatus Peregrinibacteria bacterium Greene0416_19]